MHEASILNSLMKKIDTIACGHNAVRVTNVTVWLGALSHFSADHFREHFVIASLGSIAEGANLDVTIDEDINHKNAQDILLKDIDVDIVR